ncbi:hypothetical protein M0805_004128 [Coniferiporia weirii]|nr:hypothetical protein M0805_004128 [Coniferiporia weirii]
MFKVPSTIAQDLLLIQNLIAETELGLKKAEVAKNAADNHEYSESINSSRASSDSETDSEEVDVVEGLLARPDATEGEEDVVKPQPPILSSSESSDEDSDSDSDVESEASPRNVAGKYRRPRNDNSDDEDEDEGGPKAAAAPVLRTKNEIQEPAIATPDIVEVGAHEPLEKVGEILSVIDNVVIVKGLASQVENRASERALDFESLLVFEDRKVLGYVHETFGPTYQPLYQVKFLSADSIDKETITVSRAVFHVPPRSNFVFPSQLKKIKGSDASNVHDEEIHEDEMEFSDDEAEAMYKRQRQRHRESHRESSATSSRFSTPTPSQMHDHEMAEDNLYGTSPYDEYGPYDMDVIPGPSRPSPLPYDDPYQDIPTSISSEPTSVRLGEDKQNVLDRRRDFGHENGRGRGRGRERGRGRGRGREDGRQYRGRGGDSGGGRGRGSSGTFGGGSTEPRSRRASISRNDSVGPSIPRSLSPTSMAIARATGMYADGSTFINMETPPLPPQPTSSMHNTWQQTSYGHEYGTTPQPLYGGQPFQQQQQAFIQPHINPRFASAFGIDMNFLQSQQYTPFYPSGPIAGVNYGLHQDAGQDSRDRSQSGIGGNGHPDTSSEFAVQMKNKPEDDHS